MILKLFDRWDFTPLMSDTRPNIVFIMSDDHAAHAMSCYTQKWEGRPVINRTPNIDRIAEDGVIFNNCFCTNSICTPSRAVILTGKHSHMTGVTTLRTHLDNSLPNVAKMLQANGYQTAMIGKWHLGVGKKHHPTGFDYSNVLPGQGFYKNPIMIENGKTKRIKGYVTDIITDESIKWMKNREQTKPFFLMCHHKAPHRPWVPDEKHKAMYQDEDIPYPYSFNDDYANRCDAAAHTTMQIEKHMWPIDIKIKSPRLKLPFQHLKPPKDLASNTVYPKEGGEIQFKTYQERKEWFYQRYIKDYLRCIASIDDNIGRMLDYLDENNLTENTIVIYTSDQGFFLGDHGWFDKRFMYEESLRMPFVMRYPKEIKSKSDNNDLILNLDFAETFLDFAGIPIPEDMQGRSFRPNLGDKTPKDWRKGFYYRYWQNGSDHKVYAHYGIRTLHYKLIYYYCDPLGQKGAIKDAHKPMWELFDLEKDPYELKNVYDDPKYTDIRKKMTQKLKILQKEAKDQPYSSE